MKIFNQNILNKQNLLNNRNITHGNPINPENNRIGFKRLNADVVFFASNQKQSIADKINSLKGDPFDNANKIKEILLEDMGFPKDCIQIEILNMTENEHSYCDYFNMSTGNILIHRNPQMTKQDIALIIRHELEHFKQSLGIVKYFGIEEYKKYIEMNKMEIEKRFPSVSTELNVKLFSNKTLHNLISNTREQCLSYLTSFKERSEIAQEPDSEYKSVKERYLYLKDPGEQEAYHAQNELSLSFGVKSDKMTQNTVYLEEFPKIEEKINEILTKKSYCAKYITKIFQCALYKSRSNNPPDDNLTSEENMRRMFNGIVSELDDFLNLYH